VEMFTFFGILYFALTQVQMVRFEVLLKETILGTIANIKNM
jgi:hypothetical protein